MQHLDPLKEKNTSIWKLSIALPQVKQEASSNKQGTHYVTAYQLFSFIVPFSSRFTCILWASARICGS